MKKEWRKNHPEKYKIWRKGYLRSLPGKAGQLLNNAQGRCRKSGLACTIDREWVIQGLKSGCALTNIQFEFNGVKGPRSPSIDRIDNSKGYTPENARVILNCVNMFKGTTSDEDMFEVAKHLLERRFKND